MSDFKTLQVWQKAHALSLNVDRACKGIRLPMYASLATFDSLVMQTITVRKMLYGLHKMLSVPKTKP